MNRLRKNGPTLRLLQKSPAPLQKRILDKALSELIRCLCGLRSQRAARKRQHIASSQAEIKTAQDQTSKVG